MHLMSLARNDNGCLQNLGCEMFRSRNRKKKQDVPLFMTPESPISEMK